MSTHHTTFLILGYCDNDLEITDEQEEKYYPPTRNKEKRFTSDQIAIINDCMSSAYTVIGFIYAQTDQDESFYNIIDIPEVSNIDIGLKQSKLRYELGLNKQPNLKWMIVPHYY